MKIARIITPRTFPVVLLASLGLAQSQNGPPTHRPEFEVATVKVSKGSLDGAVRMTPGRLTIQNLTLRRLILVAYRLRDAQLSGAPGWINSERYDIDAKTDGAATGADPMLQMLQNLIESRFSMRFHHETSEEPVYLLTVAKSGLKMKQASCVPFDPNNLQKQVALSDQERARQCGGINRRNGALDGDGMSMRDRNGPAFQSLAGQLSLLLDRSVVDRTGLTGRFDVHLRWTDQPPTDAKAAPDGLNAAAAGGEANGPSIFTAIQEQLGLKLESGKAPLEKFVIDQVERPTEN